MARRKTEQPSTSAKIKAIFAEHPKLLRVPSLDGVMELFYQSNPGLTVEPKYRQIAANIKSTIKHKGGKGRIGGRGRAIGAGHMGVAAAQNPTHTLERLEDKIDDCIALAKDISARGLLDVIRLLRRALNGVVVRIEEK